MKTIRNELKVGDGATLLFLTDREPVTIVEITKGFISLQYDKAVRTDTRGMSDNQDYTFSRNTGGKIVKVALRNGKPCSSPVKMPGVRIGWGYRSKYYDYSF